MLPDCCSTQNILLFVVVVAAAGYAYLLYIAKSMHATPDHESEAYFPTSGSAGSKNVFPRLSEVASKTVTVVIPAYNEEDRIRIMLDEMLDFLERHAARNKGFSYELVIVNDGSKDGTKAVVMEYVDRYGSDIVRFCDLHKNHGKGGAVRKGAMRARGEYILMADADGATKAADLSTMLSSLQNVARGGQGIAVGSRAHLQSDSDSTVKRSALRKFLMWGFHTLMALVLGGSTVKDTQCGFKLFTRATASRIFPCQHIQRWAFDVELLLLASTWGDIPVVEVPVHWEEIDGSKVDIVWDTLQMARDLVVIKACYLLGLWSDREVSSKDKSA